MTRNYKQIDNSEEYMIENDLLYKLMNGERWFMVPESMQCMLFGSFTDKN